MTSGIWYNSLRVQMVLLMTLALFPLGAVAIYQTNRVGAEADRNEGLALLTLTEHAANAEELFIEGAFGAARFFASVAQDFINNPELCSRDLPRFLASSDSYTFIGILPVSGLISCSASRDAFDISHWENLRLSLTDQRRATVVVKQDPISGGSAFIVLEPFDIKGVLAGFIAISIPHNGIPDMLQGATDLGLKDLITFNANGDMLTTRMGLDEAATELPSDRTLASLKFTGNDTFHAQNQRGDWRTYTVVPIEGSPATVLGIWAKEGDFGGYLTPAIFPILMWFASMAVALLSIYTLVLRHITKLRRSMDSFAEHRDIQATNHPVAMPNELQALANNFMSMTDDIMREEAHLEDTLREKNVLIKEVHHRVKNNLQLISSIMNMQIRGAKEQETKAVLSSLQDRVLSLAMIHRDLYQSQNGGMVDAGALVAEIVDKTVEMAVTQDEALDVETHFDRVWLYPDQAVPLSLMVAEGMTNAMKFVGIANHDRSWINASLKQDGTRCVLTLANSIGGDNDAESSGLGSKLINAFAIQLGGKIDVIETEADYTMTLRFAVEDFVPEARDF